MFPRGAFVVATIDEVDTHWSEISEDVITKRRLASQWPQAIRLGLFWRRVRCDRCLALIGLVLAWAIAIRAPASYMSSHLDSQRALALKAICLMRTTTGRSWVSPINC